MIDLTTFIAIVFAIFIIYIFIKFIVNPIFKIILGIIIFFVLIYILQKFFGFDIDQILAPFGISLNINRLLSNFNWIFKFIDYFVNQAKDLFNFIFKNIPKSSKL